jgi:hypothetical protein
VAGEIVPCKVRNIASAVPMESKSAPSTAAPK